MPRQPSPRRRFDERPNWLICLGRIARKDRNCTTGVADWTCWPREPCEPGKQHCTSCTIAAITLLSRTINSQLMKGLDMADIPEIPEELLQQVLSDPDAVAALQELAGRAGVTTPVLSMPREEQIALVTAMMGLAQKAQAEGGAPDAPANVPDDLVQQVFSDPRADTILRDIMAGNQLTGEPADLPHDIKQAIVQLLIDQGVISFDQD